MLEFDSFIYCNQLGFSGLFEAVDSYMYELREVLFLTTETRNRRAATSADVPPSASEFLQPPPPAIFLRHLPQLQRAPTLQPVPAAAPGLDGGRRRPRIHAQQRLEDAAGPLQRLVPLR